MQPPEGPPVWMALNFFPSGMPPPTSKTSCRSVRPRGTSTRPVLLILPTSENTHVPLLFSLPRLAYQSAPWLMMCGTDAHVFTLLMLVGLPQSPDCAGNGGRA